MRSILLNKWLAMLVVAGVQSAVLGYIVVERALVIRDGREIILDVRPVDPRSVFRGDYVILDYGDVTLLGSSVAGDLPKNKQALFVKLRKGGEGWQPVTATAIYPSDVDGDEVVLKGMLSSRHSRQVRYGIESYFVPEGEGKQLERLIGKGQLRVIVAVGAGGQAAIKGLEVEGKSVYIEPLL